MRESPLWLKNFYQSNCTISLESVIAEKYPPDFQDFLSPLIYPAIDGKLPVVLPYVSKSDRALVFYASSEDSKAISELRQVIKAYLGSSNLGPRISFFREPRNDAESYFLERFSQGGLRIELRDQDTKSRKKSMDLLADMLSVFQRRPDLSETVLRPVGRILRDFFSACSSENGKDAERFLAELRLTGQLSRKNLLSLEIQSLAAAHDWEGVLYHERLESFLSARVPLQIFKLLLRALGHIGLFDLCRTANLPDHQLEPIRDLCKSYTPIFVARPALEDHPNFETYWQVWIIGAVLVGRNLSQEMIPACVDKEWLSALSAWSGIPIEPLRLDTENSLSEQTDFDRLTSLLYKALIVSGDELDEILIEIDSMPKATLAQLEELPRLNSIFTDLKRERLASVGGWNFWFDEISNDNCDFVAAVMACRNESAHWASDSFNAEKVKTVLSSASDEERALTIRNALPVLVDWIDERSVRCDASFWLALIEFVSLDDFVTQEDLVTTETLLGAFLNQPHSKKHYQQVLETIELLWEKCGSASNIATVLDSFDLLLDSACPDTKALADLWQTVQSTLLNRWSRIDTADQELAKSFASEILGADSLNVFPPGEAIHGRDESSDLDLNGRLAAIYTLTAGAGLRAKKVLESMFYGLSVELNSDHVSTPSLTNIAKKADYFVFAAGSAKHQAFYAVSKCRKDLIYPQGKGSSSIVNAFISAVT